MNDKHSAINSIYDNLAADYGKDVFQSYTQRCKYILLEKYAHEDDICLDVGIANGTYSIPLAAMVKHIYGLDISVSMLDKCLTILKEKHINNVSLLNCTGDKLPYKDNSFSFVYSFSTLLLIPNILNAIHEIYRVSKKRAIVILDITCKWNISQLYWKHWYKKQGHFGVHSFSLFCIHRILNNIGFDILERYSTGLADQWKYIPFINQMTVMNKIFHHRPDKPDLDARISSFFPALANRWYFVLQKQ